METTPPAPKRVLSFHPSKYAVPDVWRPSILGGVIGLIRLLRMPRRAWSLERRQVQQYLAHRRLQQLGILDYFRTYPAEALPPQYDDLLGLHSIVLKRKPRVVLELGGGYSTIVIAHALKELSDRGHADCMLYSVDESDHWQQVVKDQMPSPLAPFVRFHRADPRLVEMFGEEVSEFDSLPVTIANLVYIDGGLAPGNQIGADAIALERNAPGDFTILIDNRVGTVTFLAAHLKHAYSRQSGPAIGQTVFTIRSKRGS